MKITRSSVTAASAWLQAMADAATGLGLTIQYCMPLPRHMLESTKHQAVTNARASGDYHPGASNFEIQTSSLFYWAIGVAPSKDDWWTTEVQTGSPYGDKPTEPNWQLQALVIGLSTGPNGPSDKIGYTNPSLVMSTVRGDGLTLQPDRPATLTDAALRAVFDNDGKAPDVRSTWTAYAAHAYRFHHVLATQLAANFSLALADLGPLGAAPAYAVFDWFAPLAGPVAVLASPSATFTVPAGQGQPSAPATAHPALYRHAAAAGRLVAVRRGGQGRARVQAAHRRHCAARRRLFRHRPRRRRRGGGHRHARRRAHRQGHARARALPQRRRRHGHAQVHGWRVRVRVKNARAEEGKERGNQPHGPRELACDKKTYLKARVAPSLTLSLSPRRRAPPSATAAAAPVPAAAA